MSMARDIGDRVVKEQLEHSNLSLLDGGHAPLRNALESINVVVRDAYVVNWIPEQGEDIYAVLVPGAKIVVVEIPRDGDKVSIAVQELAIYIKNKSKLQRRKISIAQRLIDDRARMADGR